MTPRQDRCRVCAGAGEHRDEDGFFVVTCWDCMGTGLHLVALSQQLLFVCFLVLAFLILLHT